MHRINSMAAAYPQYWQRIEKYENSFHKKEYRLLLDMISIAEWVLNAYTTEDHPQSDPYEELEQKILSYAKDYGFDECDRITPIGKVSCCTAFKKGSAAIFHLKEIDYAGV